MCLLYFWKQDVDFLRRSLSAEQESHLVDARNFNNLQVCVSLFLFLCSMHNDRSVMLTLLFPDEIGDFECRHGWWITFDAQRKTYSRGAGLHSVPCVSILECIHIYFFILYVHFQVTSLQAFESGVIEMRAVLDDTVSAKNEIQQDLERLSSLQKNFNLTWLEFDLQSVSLFRAII